MSGSSRSRMWPACAAVFALVTAAGCTGTSAPTEPGPATSPTTATPSPASARALARAHARAERAAVATAHRRALAAAHRRALAAAPPCRGPQLHLRLEGVGAGAGTYYQSFSLRNAGNAPCVVTAIAAGYADSGLTAVGFSSRPVQRFLDESAAAMVPRAALLAGEVVDLRVGTAGPGGFGDGCGQAAAPAEVISINAARFVLTRPGAVVCTIRGGAPGIVWNTPHPRPGRLPDGLGQPHLV